MVDCLKSGRLAGAALDMFETEPLTAAAAQKCSDLRTLLLTRHIAGVTIECSTRFSQVTKANARSVLEEIYGRMPID